MQFDQLTLPDNFDTSDNSTVDDPNSIVELQSDNESVLSAEVCLTQNTLEGISGLIALNATPIAKNYPPPSSA